MVVVVVYKLNLVKCFWPKASPLDLDFGLCAWAKLIKKAVEKISSRNKTIEKANQFKSKLNLLFYLFNLFTRLL